MVLIWNRKSSNLPVFLASVIRSSLSSVQVSSCYILLSTEYKTSIYLLNQASSFNNFRDWQNSWGQFQCVPLGYTRSSRKEQAAGTLACTGQSFGTVQIASCWGRGLRRPSGLSGGKWEWSLRCCVQRADIWKKKKTGRENTACQGLINQFFS